MFDNLPNKPLDDIFADTDKSATPAPTASIFNQGARPVGVTPPLGATPTMQPPMAPMTQGPGGIDPLLVEEPIGSGSKIAKAIKTLFVIIIVLVIVAAGGYLVYQKFLNVSPVSDYPAISDNQQVTGTVQPSADASLVPSSSVPTAILDNTPTTSDNTAGSNLLNNAVSSSAPTAGNSAPTSTNRDSSLLLPPAGILEAMSPDATYRALLTNPKPLNKLTAAEITKLKATDTDKDTLSDYNEIYVYKTDPFNPDTDGDGYKDGAEVKGGYNPNGPGKLPANLK